MISPKSNKKSPTEISHHQGVSMYHRMLNVYMATKSARLKTLLEPDEYDLVKIALPKKLLRVKNIAQPATELFQGKRFLDKAHASARQDILGLAAEAVSTGKQHLDPGIDMF